MVHGMRWAALRAAGSPACSLVVLGVEGGGLVSIVMGMDQHRAQISAEWIDTITGEISRARVAPADRDAVRAFLDRFADEGLEVALEATTGWRFVVEELERVGAEVHLAEPAETAALKGKKKRAKTDWADARHLRELLVDRPAAGVVDPAGAHPRPARPGPDAASALASADRVAAADALGALSPRVPAATQPAHRSRSANGSPALTLPAAAREQLTIALSVIDALDTQARPVRSGPARVCPQAAGLPGADRRRSTGSGS